MSLASVERYEELCSKERKWSLKKKRFVKKLTEQRSFAKVAVGSLCLVIAAVTCQEGGISRRRSERNRTV